MSAEEIRKQLVKSLSTAQVESVDDTGEAVIEYEADRLLQLITADRKRVALEARLDELQKYLDHYKDDYDRYADARRAELEQQLKELEAEL